MYKKGSGSVNNSFRRNSEHSPQAEQIRRNYTPRKYESFRFDPNTVSIDDLMRLGFTRKQAQSIDNYRQKGGRFRRRSDFAKSYVVEDSVFRRLERYIDIPKIDINSADSVTFMSLPGIGKFFAGKMVSYRNELGGYSYPEQLMDIWHFDQEKFYNLKDLIKLDTVATPPYSLWVLPEKDLASHPYIGKRAARSIVIFKENSPKSEWTVSNLQKAGILDPDKASKLARCRIKWQILVTCKICHLPFFPCRHTLFLQHQYSSNISCSILSGEGHEEFSRNVSGTKRCRRAETVNGGGDGRGRTAARWWCRCECRSQWW